MVCVLLDEPVSVRVIFPVYGVTCAPSAAVFTDTVRVTGPPGSTTPLVGATLSHAAVPADAVNEIGPALVVSCTACAAGAGGETKVKELGLAVRVGGGAVTTNFTLVTPFVPGGTATAGENVTAAV